MEKIKDKDTFSNVFYNGTSRKRNIFEIKSPRFTTVAFLSTPIHQEAKNRAVFTKSFHPESDSPEGHESEPQKFLDTRRAFPLVSPPRKNRKQSSIRPVSTCSLTERSLQGQTADSCGTGCWFSGHVFRLARNPESWLDSTNGYGATGVPDGLLRRFQFSLLPFLTPSVRFLPISLRNVIDNRCIKRSLPTFPPFDFSRNRKSFFFLLKSRVG